MAGSTRWRTFESRRVYRNQAATAARLAALAAHESQEWGDLAYYAINRLECAAKPRVPAFAHHGELAPEGNLEHNIRDQIEAWNV